MHDDSVSVIGGMLKLDYHCNPGHMGGAQLIYILVTHSTQHG